MRRSFASRLRPTRDEANGIIEFHFDQITLQTAEDAEAFFADFIVALEGFPKPHDVIVCFDGLAIAPAAREAYGRERASMAKAHYRHSARYSGPPQTRIATMTSAVRYQAEGLVYETREEAIDAILKARKKAGQG